MNKQSIFFTFLVGIIAITIMLMLIQLLATKLKIAVKNQDSISMSFSIWGGSLLVSFVILLRQALELIENSIELIIFSKTIDNTFTMVMQKIAIFVGFSFIFSFMAYYLADWICKAMIGERSDSIEMEKNNVGYFILKGIILLSLVFSCVSIFQHFLQWFMPTVDTPFYH